jgi:hypothetical protein
MKVSTPVKLEQVQNFITNLHDEIGASAKEDTESCPDLPFESQ